MNYKRNLLFIVVGFLYTCMAWSQYNPVANEKAVVRSGNMRFTVLTPEMIRIEYSSKQLFEDLASFVVGNRDLPVPHFTRQERDGYLYITTDKLRLRYRGGSNPLSHDPANPNLQLPLVVNGTGTGWYPGKSDP